MFDEACTFRSRNPRATSRVYPDEVSDTEEVHEERETGGEPYYAVRRRTCDVRGKVKENIEQCLVTSSLLTVFCFREGSSLGGS